MDTASAASAQCSAELAESKVRVTPGHDATVPRIVDAGLRPGTRWAATEGVMMSSNSPPWKGTDANTSTPAASACATTPPPAEREGDRRDVHQGEGELHGTEVVVLATRFPGQRQEAVDGRQSRM